MIIIIMIGSQIDCLYLPSSLENIKSESDTRQLDIIEEDPVSVSEESIGIAEEIAQKIFEENNDPSLHASTKISSTKTFKMDQETVKSLEVLLEHAMRHVSELIPSPEIKSAYSKFIDFFPPGTIGGTITIIGRELLGLLWSCIKKRRITTQEGAQQ